jgi:hypothetical protein
MGLWQAPRVFMRTTMTVIFILLLGLAALLALVIGASLFEYHKSDAAGQGMATAFTFFEAIIMAVLLAALLSMSGLSGGLRGASGAVAMVLYAGTVSALFIAVRILEKLQPGDRFQSLLQLVAVVSPGLLILYSAWSFFPGVRERIPAVGANLGIGLPILVLSVAAWVVKGPGDAATAARQQAQMQAFAEAQRRDEALVAEIKALPAGSPLAAFLAYTEARPQETINSQIDVRGAALARMSQLPNRQAEAEALLNQSDTRVLRNLADLDLQMTPRLCAGARKSLNKAAEELKPPTPTTNFEESSLDPYTINIRWLLENQCDCKAEVEELEQTIRLYPDSFARKRTLDYLDFLQGKPSPYSRS